MKRFVKVYLTLFIIAVLATNLVIVLVYGQRFLFSASDGGNVTALAGTKVSVLTVNLALIAIFLVFWLVGYSYYKISRTRATKYQQ